MQYTLAEQGRLLLCCTCTPGIVYVTGTDRRNRVRGSLLFGTGPDHGDYTCRAMYIVENMTQNRET